MRSYTERNGYIIVAEFIERGASATTDNRPEFQKMMELTTGGNRPFDIILIHSFSRLFQDVYHSEYYSLQLNKRDVTIKSITQDFGDDPSQQIARKMIAVFDEYSSLENAKHVKRNMLQNARNGFYNGLPCPLGYTTIAALK